MGGGISTASVPIKHSSHEGRKLCRKVTTETKKNLIFESNHMQNADLELTFDGGELPVDMQKYANVLTSFNLKVFHQML
jgi:hypothetical protein